MEKPWNSPLCIKSVFITIIQKKNIIREKYNLNQFLIFLANQETALINSMVKYKVPLVMNISYGSLYQVSKNIPIITTPNITRLGARKRKKSSFKKKFLILTPIGLFLTLQWNSQANLNNKFQIGSTGFFLLEIQV